MNERKEGKSLSPDGSNTTNNQKASEMIWPKDKSREVVKISILIGLVYEVQNVKLAFLSTLSSFTHSGKMKRKKGRTES